MEAHEITGDLNETTFCRMRYREISYIMICLMGSPETWYYVVRSHETFHEIVDGKWRWTSPELSREISRKISHETFDSW